MAVAELITAQQNYVSNWATQADAFITEIASLANAEIKFDVDDRVTFGTTNETSGAITDMNAMRPVAPQYDVLDFGPAPTFEGVDDPEDVAIELDTFSSTAPTLELGEAPGELELTAPEPSEVVTPNIPESLQLSPVTLQPLAPITIPPPPSTELPSFTADRPEDTLELPEATFEYAERQYQSALLDTAKAKLLHDLESGGYGIDTADEQALFDRARARELDVMNAEMEEALNAFAIRGFPLEPGEATVVQDRVRQRAIDKISDANRTITLERARLYVENRQFTLREVRELESVLLNYHTAFMARVLQASKSVYDAAIAMFNVAVQKYNAQIQAYQTDAQVFESRVRAAGLAIEMHRNQIESAKLGYEGQKLAVEVYTAELAALKNTVDIYRTRMEAANVQAQIEKTKIDAFRSRVDAYGAQVQAKTHEFQAYEARVRGQVARVDGFRAEVEAYRARADALKAKADVAIAKSQVLTENARVKVAGFQGEIEAYRASADAKLRKINAQADVYRADSAAYAAVAQALAAAYGARVSEIDANGRYLVGLLQAKTGVALANLKAVQLEADVRLNASEFGAKFYQSVIASTLGSINTLAAQIEST